MTITARTTGDGTRLFGSITAIDVAAAVKAAGGPSLDRRIIDTGGHIKTIGSHPVTVKLHPGVTAKPAWRSSPAEPGWNRLFAKARKPFLLGRRAFAIRV